MHQVNGFDFNLPLFVLASGGICAAINAEGAKCGCLYTLQELAERRAAELLSAGLATDNIRILKIVTDNILVTALNDWRTNGVDLVVFDPQMTDGVVQSLRFFATLDLLHALAAS